MSAELTLNKKQSHKIRGRGYSENIPNRYAHTTSEFDADVLKHESKIVLTKLSQSKANSILTKNNSPDVPFERSLNIYRGCEHGCIYCLARPTHSYLDLSPGLDFEQKIFFKNNAAELLEKEFLKPNYKVKTISLGNITDTYQPVEKKLCITRKILWLMLKYKHPVSLVTKSSLVERDIDILGKLAEQNLIHVSITITTLNKQLAQQLEPRATIPQRRLKTIKNLSDAGVPVSMLMAPIIPVLTDAEIEEVISSVAHAGAMNANFVMLRLPHELKLLFKDWLQKHFPLKADHILNRLKEMHGGKIYQSNFGKRMRGTGEYASMIEQRFKLACRKYGLYENFLHLDEDKFVRPMHCLEQIEMF